LIVACVIAWILWRIGAKQIAATKGVRRNRICLVFDADGYCAISRGVYSH